MIEPAKMKDAYQKVETENADFRLYLKAHADEQELDEQFLKLHKELFADYDCSKCRNCCKEYSAGLKQAELSRIAAFLKMTESDFRQKYVLEEFGQYQFNAQPCHFLKEDGSCEIEACKPDSCRDYPYTDNRKDYLVYFSLRNQPVFARLFLRCSKD
ncbi:MAG: YkgJ family cysteine cluster protein [Negativicutes bacterium]|nr:YkgJ family cysteine cluster protein [Negativicutes bacterium]